MLLHTVLNRHLIDIGHAVFCQIIKLSVRLGKKTEGMHERSIYVKGAYA